MIYDARVEYTAENHSKFKEWLVHETLSTLIKSKGNPEEIKASIFLFLHRAYEAHLDPDEIVDILGAENGSILDLSEFAGEDEEAVLSSYELLDPTISEMYQ